MRVLVLGAGVIGITSAYHLARDGHEVTVVDRQTLAASETSYANAGLVAPAHAYAWASRKAPRILFKSLFLPDQALRLKLRADPRMWSWSWLFLMQCTNEHARINTIRKLKLCLYSLEALGDVVRDTGVQYDGLQGGNLYLYRTDKSFEAGVEHTGILRDQGLEMTVVSRDELPNIEPALAPVKELIAGAVYSPTDQSGDARMFTRSLAEHCENKMGVGLAFATVIEAIDIDGDRVAGVVTSSGRLEADLYVMAAPSHLPGEGLLGHRAAPPGRQYAAHGRCRRGQPGGVLPDGRAGAVHVDRGIQRLRSQLQAGRFPRHAAHRQRALSERRRLRQAGLLGRPAPDDT
jgi:D-amino-acid dehydrogenase